MSELVVGFIRIGAVRSLQLCGMISGEVSCP